MQTIKSKDNQIFKSFNKLNQKKFRDREGLFVVEGDKLVEEAAKCGADIVMTAVREDRKDDYPEAYVFTDALFRKLTDTVNSQGVIAAVRKPETQSGLKDGNTVVMDRLQDPGNVGTVIRTCDAAGVAQIIAIRGTADIYSPKVVRSCAGSVFRVPVMEMDTDEAIALIREHGKMLAVSTPGDAVDYREIETDKDIALVIGNEANGVSEGFLSDADVRVGIPMKGDIESLNAGVAAGILIYELLY